MVVRKLWFKLIKKRIFKIRVTRKELALMHKTFASLRYKYFSECFDGYVTNKGELSEECQKAQELFQIYSNLSYKTKLELKSMDPICYKDFFSSEDSRL